LITPRSVFVEGSITLIAFEDCALRYSLSWGLIARLGADAA
jgi:hypothetical protein